MSIVASFYAPRFEKWGFDAAGYWSLVKLLDRSCKRLGQDHVVISDVEAPHGVETALFDLPENLMEAFVDGQRQLLECAHEPILFVGADCLLTRDPWPYMAGDITITVSDTFGDCRMNNGAVWCRDPALCAPVWRDALRRKPREWGQDQRTLYAALQACDLIVAELPCEQHNWTPGGRVENDAGMPTVMHFRGQQKRFMAAWAQRHLGLT